MERVTFLIEQTGDQLACLLNPESLTMRREAGVRPRESSSGQLTEDGLTDRPLLFTGGGTTEIELELLFDVSLSGSTVTTRNVRALTGPLWDLAENAKESGYGRPPLVRFLWGKTFNLLAVVAGVAERVERFTGEGIPTRSWMRMRMVRVDEEALKQARPDTSPSPRSLRERAAALSPGDGSTHVVMGGAQGDSAPEETGPSITTAAEIVETAFRATGASDTLAAAEAALSDTIDTLAAASSRLSGTDESEAESGSGEGPTPAEQLKDAADTFDRALDAAAQGVTNGNVDAVGAAVTDMMSAAGTAAEAAGALVSEAGREVADEVENALDTVGPVAKDLLTAAQTVGREVVRTSARALGTAVAATAQAIDQVATTTDRLASAASEAARQAGSALQSGLDAVSSTIDQIREVGDLKAVDRLSDAFRQLGQAVDRLWAAGEGSTAERVSVTAENVAIRVKNMKAATEAINAARTPPPSDLLRSATDALRSAVTTAQKSGDPAGLAEPSRRLRVVVRSVTSVESDALADAQKRARDALRPVLNALEAVLERGGAERLDEVADVLAGLEDAAAALGAAEQEETAHIIATAVRDREASAAAQGTGAAASPQAARRQQSERIDQIASREYGDPAYWRLLVLHNDIDRPLRLTGQLQLNVPSATSP